MKRDELAAALERLGDDALAETVTKDCRHAHETACAVCGLRREAIGDYRRRVLEGK